jgi:hypothetical protein
MSTNSRFRFAFWRGFLVVACWVLWPPAFIVGEFVVRLSRSTSRGCSIEGCTFPLSPIDMLIAVPPIIATALWWRWRRRHRDEQRLARTRRDSAA